jgi:hypothetical protein
MSDGFGETVAVEEPKRQSTRGSAEYRPASNTLLDRLTETAAAAGCGKAGNVSNVFRFSINPNLTNQPVANRRFCGQVGYEKISPGAPSAFDIRETDN